MVNNIYYCVLKSPITQIPKVDYMVIGGIYNKLDFAKIRAKLEKNEDNLVWIEKHETPKGWLDTVSKETLLQTINI